MEYIKSSMSDYEFAAWLFAKDNNWQYSALKTVPPVTHFYAHGVIIAYSIYNNENCSRGLFIKPD